MHGIGGFGGDAIGVWRKQDMMLPAMITSMITRPQARPLAPLLGHALSLRSADGIIVDNHTLFSCFPHIIYPAGANIISEMSIHRNLYASNQAEAALSVCSMTRISVVWWPNPPPSPPVLHCACFVVLTSLGLITLRVECRDPRRHASDIS
jgi:hypothetical protein